MDQGLVRLLVVIGMPFCFVGGLTAFLITYEGYTRSEKPDKRMALRVALKTAFVAYAIFVTLIVVIGFFVSRIVLNNG
jgi:hypothetical protein